MQFLSAGKRSLREKTHACDASLQPRNGGIAIPCAFVDRLHRQAHALLVLKGQFARWLENAVGVDRLDLLSHVLPRLRRVAHGCNVAPTPGGPAPAPGRELES